MKRKARELNRSQQLKIYTIAIATQYVGNSEVAINAYLLPKHF